ncbi:MAG: hypothetical protein ACM3MI_15105, partial [Clostridiales bacterium]
MKIFYQSFNENLASILSAAAIFTSALICSGCTENKQSEQKQTDSLHSSAQNSLAQPPVNTLPNFNCTGYIKAVSSGTSANYVLID